MEMAWNSGGEEREGSSGHYCHILNPAQRKQDVFMPSYIQYIHTYLMGKDGGLYTVPRVGH